MPPREAIHQSFMFYTGSPGGGGHLGIFFGWYLPPGTPIWHPVLKKIFPKTDTPFYKWANFLYSVLESL